LSNEVKSPPGAPISLQPLRPPIAAGGSASPGAPPKQLNKHDELRLLINSRHPIITVETPEEQRLEALLLDVVTELGVNAKQQLDTEILIVEIQGTQPLSVTRAEEVASIRQWAKTRAVPAD